MSYIILRGSMNLDKPLWERSVAPVYEAVEKLHETCQMSNV